MFPSGFHDKGDLYQSYYELFGIILVRIFEFLPFLCIDEDSWKGLAFTPHLTFKAWNKANNLLWR